MCIIFRPPDGGWDVACDGGPILIVSYPSDMPESEDWLPDDEGVSNMRYIIVTMIVLAVLAAAFYPCPGGIGQY